MSDEELLRAVLAREPGAWAAFYARFERLIGACVRKILDRYTALATPEDVEDMLSNVCLNLVKDDYRRLRLYDPGRGYKLSSWVGLIAMNTARDALRRRDPIHDPLPGEGRDDDDGPSRDIADGAPDPGLQVEGRERWRAFMAAVRDLDDTERTFLVLTYEQELEPEEIARRMGINVATVYSRKSRLRDKLRRLVEETDEKAGKNADGSA
jgi:RNA polymerase sigma-70 factor, ECF subfamily